MFKVIELDIDPSLSADTGVFEVAWVAMPAIEQELMYFGRQKFYKAPEYVAEKACKAIKENEKRGNPASTQVGKVRGQQLCNRTEISLETIKRMKSYLERAATYNTGDWEDKGTIAYGLWGGEPGLKWVNSILDSLENEEMGIQDFVKRNPGEERKDFINRCTEYLITQEGYPADQAYAICNSQAEDFALGDKVSFDWDGTLTTSNGKRSLETEINRGSTIYIISARSLRNPEMMELARKYNINPERIFTVGSNPEKIKKVRSLGIDRHYDDNIQVRNELGGVAQNFDYDVVGLPVYVNYPREMKRKPIPKPVLFKEDCGCKKQNFQDEGLEDACWEGYVAVGLKPAPDGSGRMVPNCVPESEANFNLVGYIDGQPVFSTPEEAEEYGETMGCSGYHEHTDENGNTVYMGCEVHPVIEEDMGTELEELLEEGNVIISIKEVTDPSEINETVIKEYSKYTKQQFYQITADPNSPSIQDFAGTKIRYIYAVGPGMGSTLIPTSRMFCRRMLGGRQWVFRWEDIQRLNAQITAEDSDRTIIPRPKGTNPDIFTWKGGANCRHIWIQLIFANQVPGDYEEPITNNPLKERRKAVIEDTTYGQGGEVNPKANPVRGSRMEASKQKFNYWENEDLVPVGYIQGLPVYDDIVDAQDASYMLNCGGVTEEVEYMGKMRFQACSYKAKKVEQNKQLFAAVEEKRMVYTPLMIPNILIPRLDEVSGEKYYVKFTPETIEKIQNKFMIEQRLRATNLEHSNKKFEDVVMVESWIVTGENDKAYELGFTKEQIPFGTWMAGYKVLDTTEGEEVWNKYIKPGVVKGASVEGNFILNFSAVRNDDYLLAEIINILNKIN